MKLKKGETILLMTATEKETIGRALYEQIRELLSLQLAEYSSERQQTINTARGLMDQLGFAELVKMAEREHKQEAKDKINRELKEAGLL